MGANDCLEGRVALVTGGNSGLGLAAAKCLAAAGAKIFVVGRRRAELEAAAEEIGGDVVAVSADVTSRVDLDRVFRAIRESAGKIDIVFANAGVLIREPLVFVDAVVKAWTVLGANLAALEQLVS